MMHYLEKKGPRRGQAIEGIKAENYGEAIALPDRLQVLLTCASWPADMGTICLHRFIVPAVDYSRSIQLAGTDEGYRFVKPALILKGC
jgi:hypothetical protein